MDIANGETSAEEGRVHPSTEVVASSQSSVPGGFLLLVAMNSRLSARIDRRLCMLSSEACSAP